MAKPDRTPWEPGFVVIPAEEVVEPNPYNGAVYALHQLTVVAFILSQSCYRVDSRISLILKQSQP